MEAMTRRPILLGAYAAKQCPVRVHHDFDTRVPRVDWAPSPELQARFEAGRVFEDRTRSLLADTHAGAMVIGPALSPAEAVASTLAAMAEGAPLIINAWLPDDEGGGRKGRPDILIGLDGGYLPAEVKNHVTLKAAKRATAVVSRADTPTERLAISGWSSAAKHRFSDGMQLAHYTRMLQACGRHAGPLWGAVLGTTQAAWSPDDEDPSALFVWIDLNEPLYETFSRSEGRKVRSLLERYDHEHGFRLAVADTAVRIVGGPDDPPPLVQPIGQDECNQCPYGAMCADLMGPDDPSTAITEGRLSPREYQVLRQLGIDTTAALSAVNPDDAEFFDEYYAEVSDESRDRVRRRLGTAVERARMICNGQSIARLGSGPVDVPRADIEIDLDVESDSDNRVYLWGVRIRDGEKESTAQYVSDFTDWDPLDPERERELAHRFVAWLREQRRVAVAAGRTIAVFHWTEYEITRLRAVLGQEEIADLIDPIDGVFVDLHKVFKANFFSAHGAKLKVVAPVFGFAWRVADPGGGISQLYLAKVHHGSEPREIAEAKEWLLSYNEDDTAATARIRDGMREWTD